MDTKHRITIAAKELSRLPDFEDYHERSLYRIYSEMRNKLGVPRSQRRFLTVDEVANCLGVDTRTIQSALR